VKKIKIVNGLIIAKANPQEVLETGCLYHVFTKYEWGYGQGCRTAEWQTDTKDFLNGIRTRKR
jgi:hypothetical protein